MTQAYVLISIIVLAIIAILAIYTGKSKGPKRISKLATFSMSLVVLGIVFGNNRLVGYSFMGAGIILGVIDIIKNLKIK